jgi:4-amino-4-deoxy-L-arabinose transferase
LFFSLSRGKLLTYILPCFPPFAILLAFGLSQALTQNPRCRLFQRGVAASTALFGLVLVAFLGVQLVGIHGKPVFGQPWKVVMVVNGFIFFVLFGVWSILNQSAHTKLILFGLSPALLFLVVHFTVPDMVTMKKSPGPFLAEHKPGIAADTIIISEDDVIRATCWYLQRSDVYVLGRSGGELKEGMRYMDAKGRLLDLKSAVALINQNRGKTILIAKAKTLARLQNDLPRPVSQDQSGPSGYGLWKY